MKGMILTLLVVGAAVTMVPLASSAVHAEDSLWYRGLFDGKVEILDEGIGLYQYTPSRPSAYPLREQRYSITSYYWWGRPRSRIVTYQKSKSDDEEKTDSKGKDHKVYTLYPLPGQYWYKRQPHFNFRTPITIGWPYLKYDQRH